MKTLVILHGWQSSKERWQKVKNIIENSGIKVICPDIPGFKKDSELKEPWNLDNYINWFNNYLTSENITEEFFLLGHSFGGRMTIKIAATGCHHLDGIILVSAAGIKNPPSLRNKGLGFGARTVRALRLKELPLTKGAYQLFRKFFYCYILRKTDYINTSGFLTDTIKNVLDEDLSPYLSKISVPSMIIWGKADKITPLRDAYLMKEKIKESQIQLIDRVGHTPHIEAPEKLAEIIIKFVNNTIQND